MDISEARHILEQEMNRYRQRSYQELTSLIGEEDVLQRTGPSGKEYQLEITALWDRQPNGGIHVIASIDDGSFWHSLNPQTDDFIMAPDGSLRLHG